MTVSREAKAQRPAPLNSAIEETGNYPFLELKARLAELKPADLDLISFSAGDPRDRTTEFVRDALRAGVPEVSSYPSALGSPELRGACAAWVQRRFGVELDLDAHILSANGTKEAVFMMAQTVVDRDADARNTVVIPTPAYPVYQSGARMAGARTHYTALTSANGWRFDPDQVADDVWQRTALLWLNSPHNPTGATLGLETLSRVVECARRHGFWVASDEAYIDVYFDDPPHSLIECGLDNVVALHSLSKRSAMTGYRSGFMAGDPRLIQAMKKLRPHVGVGTPEFIQKAAIAAWQEDDHAARQREAYRAKRDLFVELFGRRGWTIEASEASFYLWFRVPGGDDMAFAEKLMRLGMLAFPGSFFGESGAGLIRWALVPTLEQCREAARRLEALKDA